MKQIKLKDGVTLMAVFTEHPELTHYLHKNNNASIFLVNDAGFNWQLPVSENLKSYHCLGTAPELLAREDAEEVIEKYVKFTDDLEFENMLSVVGSTRYYYDYMQDVDDTPWKYDYVLEAKASFQSALSALNYVDGEILIIKVEG